MFAQQPPLGKNMSQHSQGQINAEDFGMDFMSNVEKERAATIY